MASLALASDPTASELAELLKYRQTLSTLSSSADLLAFITTLLSFSTPSSPLSHLICTLLLQNPVLCTSLAHRLPLMLTALSYTHQLSPLILAYPPPTPTPSDSRRVCHAVSSALPPTTFATLSAHLLSGPNYFTAHSYSDGFTGTQATPYFSYIIPLTDSAPTTFIAALVKQIYTLCVPCVGAAISRAKFAEVWMHSRPHASGHQFHFDSDNEGLDGPPRHPICSSVLYITDEVGGPTCVTSLKLGSGRVPRRSYLCHPKENSLVCFDGSVLHGVLPGHGVPADPAARRVTLMVAFWDDIRVRDSPGIGAARAMPNGSSCDDEWVKLFNSPPPEDLVKPVAAGEEILPTVVDGLFVEVEGGKRCRVLPEINDVFMF